MTHHLTSLKRNLFAWCTMVIVLSVFSQLQAQVRSDFEIKRSFDRKVEEVRRAIPTISSATTADSLLSVVNQIENEFNKDKTLLNQTLRPKSVEGILSELRSLISVQQAQLKTIDVQQQEITVLNEKVTLFSSQLAMFAKQTDSLRQVIARTNASEQVMSNLVKEYKARLEQRDQLIRQFVDSLIITFDDPELRRMGYGEQNPAFSRLVGSEDALKIVQSIIEDNIKIISGTTEFDAEFYLKMNTLQRQIEQMWMKIGPTIAAVYQGQRNVPKVDAAVKDRLDTWRQRVQGAMWNAMHRSFTDTGILINDFDSREGFLNSVNAYLDTTLVRLEENVTEQDYQNYERFKQFWTDQVKGVWGPMLLENQLLTMEELTAIDQKVEDWGIKSRPRSDNLVIYLIISGIVIAVLGVLLFMAKRKSA